MEFLFWWSTPWHLDTWKRNLPYAATSYTLVIATLLSNKSLNIRCVCVCARARCAAALMRVREHMCKTGYLLKTCQDFFFWVQWSWTHAYMCTHTHTHKHDGKCPVNSKLMGEYIIIIILYGRVINARRVEIGFLLCVAGRTDSEITATGLQ